MSDYGFKDSIIGQDAASVDINKLSASSDYPVLKSKLGQIPKHFSFVQTTAFSASAGTSGTFTLLTIPHGYSYIPATFCIASFNDAGLGFNGQDYALLPRNIFPDANDNIFAYADSTNLYIELQKDGTGGITPQITYTNFIINLKYYIFDENAD